MEHLHGIIFQFSVPDAPPRSSNGRDELNIAASLHDSAKQTVDPVAIPFRNRGKNNDTQFPRATSGQVLPIAFFYCWNCLIVANMPITLTANCHPHINPRLGCRHRCLPRTSPPIFLSNLAAISVPVISLAPIVNKKAGTQILFSNGLLVPFILLNTCHINDRLPPDC